MPIYNKPSGNLISGVFSENGTNTVKPNANLGYKFADIPDFKEHNYQFNKSDAFNKHINEAGIPEYDNETTYSIGSFVAHVVLNDVGNRRIYQSLTDNNINNEPILSPTQWFDVTLESLKYGYIETVGTNVMTASIRLPKIIQYTVGQRFYAKISVTNTSSVVTLSINGLPVRDIVLSDNTAIKVGDLVAGTVAILIMVQASDSLFKFFLLNPAISKTSKDVTVFERTSPIVAEAGDYNTDLVTEANNKYFNEDRVRNSLLTGLTLSNTPVVPADNILAGIGKLQGQIENNKGKIVQRHKVVRTTLAIVSKDSTPIPLESPTATAGTEIISMTITPKKIGNSLVIRGKLANVLTPRRDLLFLPTAVGLVAVGSEPFAAVVEKLIPSSSECSGTINLEFQRPVTTLIPIVFTLRLSYKVRADARYTSLGMNAITDALRTTLKPIGANASKSFLEITEIEN